MLEFEAKHRATHQCQASEFGPNQLSANVIYTNDTVECKQKRFQTTSKLNNLLTSQQARATLFGHPKSSQAKSATNESKAMPTATSRFQNARSKCSLSVQHKTLAKSRLKQPVAISVSLLKSPTSNELATAAIKSNTKSSKSNGNTQSVTNNTNTNNYNYNRSISNNNGACCEAPFELLPPTSASSQVAQQTNRPTISNVHSNSASSNLIRPSSLALKGLASSLGLKNRTHPASNCSAANKANPNPIASSNNATSDKSKPDRTRPNTLQIPQQHQRERPKSRSAAAAAQATQATTTTTLSQPPPTITKRTFATQSSNSRQPKKGLSPGEYLRECSDFDCFASAAEGLKKHTNKSDTCELFQFPYPSFYRSNNFNLLSFHSKFECPISLLTRAC